MSDKDKCRRLGGPQFGERYLDALLVIHTERCELLDRDFEAFHIFLPPQRCRWPQLQPDSILYLKDTDHGRHRFPASVNIKHDDAGGDEKVIASRPEAAAKMEKPVDFFRLVPIVGI